MHRPARWLRCRGELTNAIREKPFCVVLFDEIEKADPRILDKFLQILDDGVFNVRPGDRVYFTEAFIVFTSNLGIYRVNANHERIPNVTPDDAVETVKTKVLAEIERYFKVELNRPEILNRIGDISSCSTSFGRMWPPQSSIRWWRTSCGYRAAGNPSGDR